MHVALQAVGDLVHLAIDDLLRTEELLHSRRQFVLVGGEIGASDRARVDDIGIWPQEPSEDGVDPLYDGILWSLCVLLQNGVIEVRG